MFGWLKNLFGGDTPDTPEIAKAPVSAPAASTGKVTDVKVDEKAFSKKTESKAPAKKAAPKKAAPKKAEADLSSMNKRDLLAHAKANGVKANASMNKDAIIKAIKNG